MGGYGRIGVETGGYDGPGVGDTVCSSKPAGMGGPYLKSGSCSRKRRLILENRHSKSESLAHRSLTRAVSRVERSGHRGRLY